MRIRTLRVSSRKRRFSSWFPKSASAPLSGNSTRFIRTSGGAAMQSELSIYFRITTTPRSPNLLVADGRGRAAHQVGRAGRLGERDHVPDGRFPGQDHDDAVEAEGDAAVGRSPVLEGLEEEAEALLRLLFGHREDLEDPGLQRRVVDAEAAAADLGPVQHDVVGLRPHRRGVACPGGHVLVARRGERMVQARVARSGGVVVQQREVRDPQEPERALVHELQLAAHLQAQDAHGHGQRLRRVDADEHGVVLGRAGLLQQPPGDGFARPLLDQVGHGFVGGLEREQRAPRGPGVGDDAAQPQLLVDLPQPRARHAARRREGRSRARAPLPRSAPGKESRPSVSISSVTSAIGISKRRSGLSLP